MGEVHETFFDLFLRRSGLEAEEGEGEVAAVVVDLRREVVGLGFSTGTDAGGVFVAVVNVVRQGFFVIEEFREHGPALVLVPEFANQFVFENFYGIFEENQLILFSDDKAETFVFAGERAVVGWGGGREPAFVDAAAFAAERIIIVGVQFDAASGNAEGARHPVGGEPENALALFHGGLKCGFFIHWMSFFKRGYF